MIGADLSLDQAPPISVPFRFFLTAPLFGLLSGLFILISPPEAFASRWSIGSLAITHLMILGFLVLTMMGAVFQILPVIASATVKHVNHMSAWILLFHCIGTLGLSYGFITSDWTTASIPLIFLVLSILSFVTITFISLSKTQTSSDSVLGIRLSVISLFLTLGLGILLLMSEAGMWLPFFRPGLTNLHLTQGLVGTVFLLIVSVSYQVIPMFYVTSSYPKWITRRLAPMTFSLIVFNLVMTSISEISTTPTLGLSRYLLLFPIAIYCIETGRLINQRRRKTFDVSLWFWKTSLIFTLSSLVFWLLNAELWMGTLAILAISSAVIGMLTKIIPFLIWFHLQSQCSVTPGFKVPHMKAIITDRMAKITYALFLFAAGSSLLFLINGKLFQYWTGIAICGFFLFLLALILRCIGVYRKSLEKSSAEI